MSNAYGLYNKKLIIREYYILRIEWLCNVKGNSIN
jgi:hypothetical protein